MICFLDVKRWTFTVIDFWYCKCKSWVKADGLHIFVSFWFWFWFFSLILLPLALVYWSQVFLMFFHKMCSCFIQSGQFWHQLVPFNFLLDNFCLGESAGLFCADIVEIYYAFIDDLWYFFAQRSTVVLCFVPNLKYISN